MNRLSEYISNQTFKNPRKDLSHLRVELSRNEQYINVYFSTVHEQELLFNELFYETEAKGELLGLIEAYFCLIQGKAVEAVDRLTMKELDYFLRKDNAIPSFDYYTPKQLEVLSVGEELRRFIIPSVELENIVFDSSVNGDFFDLSYSEQLDYLEEVFSKHIYSNSSFDDCHFDFEVEESLIYINSKVKLDSTKIDYIVSNIKTELSLKKEVQIIINWP